MCEGSCVSGEKGSKESGARASSPATMCLAKGCGTGILPVFHGFIFDLIDPTDLIGRASVPTSRLPLYGRMVSGFIAERREGQASACPAALERFLRAVRGRRLVGTLALQCCCLGSRSAGRGKRLLACGRADARPSPAAVTPPPRKNLRASASSTSFTQSKTRRLRFVAGAID